ncbi:MAG: amidohydrolase family protein [Planctomycetota bacterium]
MKFFDCCASFGVYQKPPLRRADTAEDLLREMDYCGIAEALVCHAAIEDDCPTVGNPLICKEIEKHPRLHGTWAILPPQTGELGSPEEFLAAMKEHNIKALWTFPDKHRYIITASIFGDLFDLLTERNVPLFMTVAANSGGISGWMLADHILRDFPKLTLVMTKHGSWGHDRYFRGLIETYENFHIDTSRYELDGGISDFVKKYGSDRILYGSNYPFTNMGGPTLTLAHADIPDADKEAIAGGNLRRLLGRVKP